MSQFRVSATARSDLDEIWLYIAQDNPEAANKFIQAIVAKFPKLAAWGGEGAWEKEEVNV